MKYIIFILISTTLFLQGCKAQNISMENQEIIIPEIDNKFEKFDKETFNKENIRGKRTEITKDYFVEEDTQSPGYARQIYSKTSIFSILKLYFENENIEKKGITFNNGSEYGIWYEFDEEGKLINEINTDAGYDYGWEDIIKYSEKNKIILTKGNETSGFQTTIYKEESEDGNKIWVITYQISGDQLIELTLDGKTGKEINKKELEFINH